MSYRRQGYPHGAWEISLDGKAAIVKATGARAFPELDRFYVPKIADPKTWDDYLDEIIAHADQQLCALLI